MLLLNRLLRLFLIQEDFSLSEKLSPAFSVVLSCSISLAVYEECECVARFLRWLEKKKSGCSVFSWKERMEGTREGLYLSEQLSQVRLASSAAPPRSHHSDWVVRPLEEDDSRAVFVLHSATDTGGTSLMCRFVATGPCCSPPSNS